MSTMSNLDGKSISFLMTSPYLNLSRTRWPLVPESFVIGFSLWKALTKILDKFCILAYKIFSGFGFFRVLDSSSQYWVLKILIFIVCFSLICLVNSPLLSHLAEAGLLSEVSDLLARAKARDESQLKRYQQQAKDLETQIVYKQKEIERIKTEVEALRKKRTRCDDETSKLKRKLASCTNAIREIPVDQTNTTSSTSSSGGGGVHSSAPSPLVSGNTIS